MAKSDCDHIGSAGDTIEGNDQVTRCGKCGTELRRIPLSS